MTIGETLKRARKKMGLDLDEVVRSTKIAKMFIIALENDDIESLPKGVYTRNFLRTYARFLKLDPDIITAEYHEQYAIKPQYITHQEQTKKDNQEFVKLRNRALLVVVCVLAVVGGGIYVYVAHGEALQTMINKWTGKSPARSVPPPIPEASDSPGSTTPQPEEAAPTGNDAAPQQPEPEEQTPIQNQTPAASAVDSSAEPSPEQPAEPAPDTPPAQEASQDSAPDPADGDDAGPSEADEDGTAAADGTEETAEPEPVVIGEPMALPIKSIADAQWTQPGAAGERLDDMFAIEALAPVWVRVAVDGEDVTYRQLNAGDVRYYRYGTENEIMVGDTYRVSIQAGTKFRRRVHIVKTKVSFSFGPGALFPALDEAVAQIELPEEE